MPRAKLHMALNFQTLKTEGRHVPNNVREDLPVLCYVRDKFFKENLKKEIYLNNLKIVSLFSRGHFYTIPKPNHSLYA